VTAADVPRTAAGLREAYLDGLRPSDVAAAVLTRVAAHGDAATWIGGVDGDALVARARRLEADPRGPDELPLYGVPFAVKDNIDVAGLPTTAACPEFASIAEQSAPVVELLEAAGALLVGKTNMDQFATGLVGTRSPYGTPRNAIDARLVPGGSSSGSGVAVGAGLVTFALGTDTAGSGRVPATMNGVLGVKPTRGLLSTRGVIPACRSIDCVSVFALTAPDAAVVLDVLDRHDPPDPFSLPTPERNPVAPRPVRGLRIGVPDLAPYDLGPGVADAHARHVAELVALGALVVPVDVAPLLAIGALLYQGPWVAERLAGVGDFLAQHPAAGLPLTRGIIERAAAYTAVDAFRAGYRLRELCRDARPTWDVVDALVLPSVPRIPTVADVEAAPLAVNAELGLFSTFVNLADLCAVAVPGGRTVAGLPVGFTLVAPAGHDRALLAVVAEHQASVGTAVGADVADPPRASTAAAVVDDGRLDDGERVELAVVGAHLSGQPLNHQLVDRGARLVARTTTAAAYRLHALALPGLPKPGLERVDVDGAPVVCEVWSVPVAGFGAFVAEVPAPLAIGKVELADGRWVSGFVCEPAALGGAVDITAHGGWEAWLTRGAASAPTG
jgi:allophanate hydrolase